MLVYCVLLFTAQDHSKYGTDCSGSGKTIGWQGNFLHVDGELAEIAESVNKASNILSKQNEASQLD